MSEQITTILNNATVPSGEFGTTEAEGVLGVIQFTNHSDVPGRIEVQGSNDGINFGNVDNLKANPGATVIERLRLPQTIKFFNPSASFGPVTLILKSAND